jgi:hypothetical protein
MTVPDCRRDPSGERQNWFATPGRLTKAGDNTVPASGLEMPLAELLESAGYSRDVG